ncbi:kelch-like protein 6 [Coccinella septempunctata]|uniref:kelch-like protein 6 n=1 Tax=Coccinella septempunctata TaxID=41139 RepID=UPI001D07D49D|nr:kelch-like protein 6 [Coccinella septempunctata]
MSSEPMSQKLCSNPEDTITLLVEDRKILCSKVTLKLHSHYFHAMFTRNFKESNEKTITLKEVDGETMEELLRLLVDKVYLNKISDITKVITLSDMFLFDKLKEELAKEAIRTLSKNNCLQIWMELKSISAFPLIWKAKSISLTNFNYQRHHGLINNLELSQLMSYLSHINLQTYKEIHVFNSVLEWIYSNHQSVDEVPFQEILGSVLNFKDISVPELKKIKCHDEILRYPNIGKILEYVIDFKCGKNVAMDNKNSQIAFSWLTPRGRYLPNYLCVLNLKHKFEIFYQGRRKDSYMKKVATIPSSIQQLVGFEIQVHKTKIYIFGGEYVMGSGAWNDRMYKFDLEEQKLIDTKYSSAIKRRHFKSCLIGDILYVIGGTGPYRIKENSMLFFNFKTGKWGPRKIHLPCQYLQSKCCNFNECLFILDFDGKCGYFFRNENGQEWRRVKICETVQLEEYALLSMFSYRGNLFLKGRKLVELELIDGVLIPKKVDELPNNSYGTLIETICSHNIVYSLYVDVLESDIVRMEYLNLDNMESKFFKRIGLFHECNKSKSFYLSEFYGANLTHNSESKVKLFMLHHHKLVEDEDILVDNN